MADKLLYMLLGAAVGLTSATLFAGEPIAYPEIIVPAARIIEREPPARPPTIVERVVYVNVPAAQTAVAPSAVADEVAAFCKPVIAMDTRTDTVEVGAQEEEPEVDRQLLIRSGVYREPSIWAPFSKAELRLTGPTNTGDLVETTYRVRGSHDFRVSGDSVIVRHGRFELAEDVLTTGLQLWGLWSAVHALSDILR